jgi:hypothetical protein
VRGLERASSSAEAEPLERLGLAVLQQPIDELGRLQEGKPSGTCQRL